MAEAHNAVEQPRVEKIQDGASILTELKFEKKLRRTFVRRFYRTRNLIYNRLWPTSAWNLCALMVPLTALQLFDWPLARPITNRLRYIEDFLYLPQGCPTVVKSVLGSAIVSVGFFIMVLHVRRYSLRILFAYRGWMYELPKRQSPYTILWAIMVRVIGGCRPSLYSYQLSLPRMTVPSLKRTVSGLLESLKPLYGEDSESFKTISAEAEKFLVTVGPKLQKVLVLRSWWVHNWVSDWWEKYVYLMNRSPLPINSNYYVIDQCQWKPTDKQTARAAVYVYHLLLWKQKIDREQLEPLLIRDTVPVCMAQYKRIFSTTRIPGIDTDTLLHKDRSHSKYIVVLRKGIFYRVEVYNRQGRLKTAWELQKQMDWIVKDSDLYQDEYTESEKSLAALTTMERGAWAKIRQDYFCTGINKQSLDTLEGAILMVTLGTHHHDNLSDRAKFLLHGDGKSIWFDKSLSVIVASDGRCGLNCEHSYADAPVIGHAHEFVLIHEICDCNFDFSGNCLCDSNTHSFIPPCRISWNINKYIASVIDKVQETLIKADIEPSVPSIPQRLEWHMPLPVSSHISKSLDLHKQNCDNLDLVLREHSAYGKDFIKKCKVSPDAYIQMAMQLTYYRTAGKFALTYEASMTRLYLHGRTETVRTLSTDSVKFVRAMNDSAVSDDEKIALLRDACSKHVLKYKDAMNGLAIDRHLFALYVTSRSLGYESEFLKTALSVPWTLSTSQQPQQQISWSPDCSLPCYQDKVCPGGGFGPVSADGYGVSYMLAGEYKIFFHVSSNKSVSSTCSTNFTNQLFETLAELQDMFERSWHQTKEQEPI